MNIFPHLSNGRVAEPLAREIASRCLALYFDDSEVAAPDRDLWSFGNLPESPMERASWDVIYDVDGRPLFHDYRLPLRDQRELTIRVAADVRLGAAHVSMGISRPGCRFAERLERAKSLAAELGMPQETPVTCFSYPRLGLLARRGEQVEIVEIGNGKIWNVDPRALPSSPLDLRDDREGLSPFESWLAGVELVDAVWNGADSSFLEAARADRQRRRENYVSDLQYVEQIDSEHCVPASAEMILRFHRFNGIGNLQVWQQAIGTAMGTQLGGATGLGGTDINAELHGYEKLLGADKASADRNPIFEEARMQIDGTDQIHPRPCKIGNDHHAMVVAGWRAREDGHGGVVKPKLYLYDPDPAQGIRWEDFSPKLYRNYVFVSP